MTPTVDMADLSTRQVGKTYKEKNSPYHDCDSDGGLQERPIIRKIDSVLSSGSSKQLKRGHVSSCITCFNFQHRAFAGLSGLFSIDRALERSCNTESTSIDMMREGLEGGFRILQQYQPSESISMLFCAA